MKIKISFHNMPHSEPLEAHSREKLEKIKEFLSDDDTPFYAELWLTANKQHPHHTVELNVRNARLDLNAHDENPDMYVAVDNTIDKIVSQIIKSKERTLDKHHKPDTEKKNFSR